LTSRSLIVAEVTLRGLARRRLALALLILLPLTMYFAQHDHVGQSVRFLALGLAWATSTVALFATIAAREIEPRLVVAGWWWLDLLAGRLFALIMLALALAAGYMALIVLNRPIDNDAAVGLDLVVTAVIAVLLGALFGVAAPRELDGVLVLFIVSSLQFIADPPTALAQLLPFWSTRELATYAIDGADAVHSTRVFVMPVSRQLDSGRRRSYSRASDLRVRLGEADSIVLRAADQVAVSVELATYPPEFRRDAIRRGRAGRGLGRRLLAGRHFQRSRYVAVVEDA
jgi:hypothetical protein